MELDLDAFLASQTSTDDEVSDDDVPHRTVDEILNDSSPPSPVGSPKTLSKSRATETVKPFLFDESNLRLNSITPEKSGKHSSLLGQSVLHPFPPLFGGARSTTKPGAALAAAAAASRSVATPHAAAIKLRKASSLTLGKIVGVGEPSPKADDTSSGFASEGSHSDGKSLKEDVQWDNHQYSSSERTIRVDDNGESPSSDEVAESEGGRTSLIRVMQAESGPADLLMVDASDEILSDTYSDKDTAHNLEVEQVPSSPSPLQEDSPTISQLIDASESADDGVDSSPGRIANELTLETIEFEEAVPHSRDDDVSFPGGESGFVMDGMDLFEDKLSELESNNRERTQGISFTFMKPFELAEELEKKHAFTGLDWENGIAAQPMRLEGVRRGSTALGYFDVHANNIITRTISSQAFRRDQGSPQVVAVHLNFIAVGLSKGLILVVPSKYSPHSADNMDGKILMLGLQGDISHSPVTSICFNQQGDLLFAGYGDGHINVWDVLKGSSMKLITGIHEAPVVHMLYLGHDSQATRKFKVVSGDSKGLVWLITFSMGAWVNRFSFSTVCLLDGKTTGKVLCASPLLLDECCGGALMSSQGNTSGSNSGIGSMMGGVLGGDAGWKLSNEKSSLGEEGVVILGTYQSTLVARVSPTVTVYAQLSKPDGVREGSMPYTAWKCMGQQHGSVTDNTSGEASDKVSLLAIAWDRKVQVAKFVKSELKVYGKWTLESSAIGVAWLDDQMLVVLTSNGQLCLFAKDGTLIHQTSFAVDESRGDDLVAYHTQFANIFGNPEKAFHNCIAVRGASIYILGPTHLIVCRLLPWKERIQVLRKAGDWMGALNMAMTLFDGQAHGVIDLPRTIDAVQEAIMPFLEELLLSYVDEVFSYISVAFCNQIEKLDQLDDTERRTSSVQLEIKEQFSRVGGVAVEFCVHIKRKDVLFDEILSKFVAVQHRDTFLELLEPYILKDMLGSLPPEIMQALVEHYSTKGWLQRIEQCVLHMDISSLDFNQVVRLCREHRLYGALIYLFNKGLDDFRAPLEELLTVLQNSEKDKAASLGFRMLVYLKYCFTGLAFPPGHGTLPPERLPSLRTELVQFLLESSVAPNSLSMEGFVDTEARLNIYYLLELDTEATLDVLRCAFLEDETPKSDYLQGLADKEVEGEKDLEPYAATQNVLVQKVVDALIYVLDKSSFEENQSTSDGEIKAVDVWPSKKDVGHMLEFIAYNVSCKKAKAPNSTLYRILEYLTSDIVIQPSIPKQNLETPRKRQKQVLALLETVSDTDWDAPSVLNLCERVQFYQACGFIHTIGHQYIAALDSYMKDVDEPIYTFSFINDALQRLTGPQAYSFRSTVISQIPQLTIICRQATFFLVNDHFGGEYEHIFEQLRSHPKSLFLYLKTIFEIHLSGTLDFSCLKMNETAEFCSGRASDQSIQTYLEKISEFPKFLRNNPVQITDEMVELYLELLCQQESNSVLKFLETFENYRVEYCLRLCQEHGIRDAAAFLLERVGDVGSALLLTLSGLDEKFVMLDTAVGNVVSNAGVKSFSTALKKEVKDIFDILHACVGLCQRNTLRLIPDESEILWFELLDAFCEPLKDSITGETVSDGENHVRLPGPVVIQEACIIRWKIMKTNKGANMLRDIFSQFIKAIVEGMIGYIRLPTIMSKLLSDNGGQEFGDFKVTILGMLGTYGFERRILDTARSLIEDDTFYTMSLLKKGASHGYAPQSPLCCLCNCLLTKKTSSSGIRVFSCGHASHIQCELEENGMTRSGSLDGCPVCIPKKMGHQSRSKAVLEENGLVKSMYPSRPHQIRETTTLHHPHESDAFENSYGASQVSRFEILNNLQKDQKSIHLENLPVLRLAPPAVYHEKVKKKGIDIMGASSSGVAKSEKPSKSRQLRELKVRGSLIRLPLKSNIFGKERSNKR